MLTSVQLKYDIVYLYCDKRRNYYTRMRTSQGYTFKYSPLRREFSRAKPEGTPEGEELYLTVYPQLSPHTVYSFNEYLDICYSIVIQGRVIWEELIFSIPFPERAIFHHILPRGYISQYTP